MAVPSTEVTLSNQVVERALIPVVILNKDLVFSIGREMTQDLQGLDQTSHLHPISQPHQLLLNLATLQHHILMTERMVTLMTKRMVTLMTERMVTLMTTRRKPA